MALTRDFRDTIRERAQRDAGFRRPPAGSGRANAGWRDGSQQKHDPQLHQCHVGFPALAAAVHTRSERLMRMFGARETPQCRI